MGMVLLLLKVMLLRELKIVVVVVVFECLMVGNRGDSLEFLVGLLLELLSILQIVLLLKKS